MQTKWEVEQKFWVHNAESLKKRLEEFGFRLLRTEQHSDTYFRHPCRDFRATDEALRLRSLDDQTFVTYKGKRLESKVKTRPEIELGVETSDYDQWTTMLTHLGFEPLPAVRKTRQVFACSGEEARADFTVTFDTVESLGEFAEIELLVARQEELSDAQERILSLAADLDLTDTQTQSYLSQLLAKLGIQK